MDVGGKFFTQSGAVLALLPRQAVGATSLKVLKGRLDGALGSPEHPWGATLPVADGLEVSSL